MRLGLNLGFQTSIHDPAPLALEAERIGYHSGPDIPSPSKKRPPLKPSSVAAVIAVIAGVRAGI